MVMLPGHKLQQLFPAGFLPFGNTQRYVMPLAKSSAQALSYTYRLGSA